jgi:hypothetical protein
LHHTHQSRTPLAATATVTVAAPAAASSPALGQPPSHGVMVHVSHQPCKAATKQSQTDNASLHHTHQSRTPLAATATAAAAAPTPVAAAAAHPLRLDSLQATGSWYLSYSGSMRS